MDITESLGKPVLGTGRFFLSFDYLSEMLRFTVDPIEAAAAVRIFCGISYGRISWYSECQMEPSVKNDDKVLASIAMLDAKQWKEVRRNVLKHFVVRGRRVYLPPNAFYLNSKTQRDPLPARLREAVFDRDGEVCAYCLTTDGPFEIDHIHPVAKGGSDDLENLTVSCKSCNRSKRDKLVGEWANG